MKGQLSHDLRHPEADPFHNGIPSDIEDRAREYWFNQGVDDPTPEDILDVSYTIYEQDVRQDQKDDEYLYWMGQSDV